MFKITVETGAECGEVFLSPLKLEEGMTFLVGREASSAIRLTEDYVSSCHGEFVFFRSHLYFRDLRSTNGAILVRDGLRRPIDEVHGLAVQLRDEDRILIGAEVGGTRLRVELFEEAKEASSAAPAAEDGLTILAVSDLENVHELEGRVAADPELAGRLFQASQLMGASLELREVCRLACAAIFDLLPAGTHVTVLLDQQPMSLAEDDTPVRRGDLVPFVSVDREGNQVAGEQPSRHVVSHVLTRRAALLICDTAAIDPSQSILRKKIRSVIGVPLAVGPRVVGIVQVDSRMGEGQFTARDVEALAVLARQMALAIDNARLFQRLKTAEARATGENRFLKEKEERQFKDIIGESAAMRRVLDLVERVRDTRATILVTGETGTGKELVARAIHYRSNRRDKLFVAQNCSALPIDLLESELFGHRKGAFTGADSDKKGLFEMASGGTIFLDEIGETTPVLQAKLLRVLQENEIRPVGATYPRKIDARVVAATNRNLEEEVERGVFREDLFYRLNVFPIHLPPLRERGEDIPLLAEHFLQKFTREFMRPTVHFAPEATLLLQTYPWPGNIRELENEVQRLVIYGVPGDLVLPEHLASRIRSAQTLMDKVGPVKAGLKSMMEEVERWILLDTLRAHDNNKTRAAETLQITREGLHKKLARFGIG